MAKRNGDSVSFALGVIQQAAGVSEGDAVLNEDGQK